MSVCGYRDVKRPDIPFSASALVWLVFLISICYSVNISGGPCSCDILPRDDDRSCSFSEQISDSEERQVILCCSDR